MHRIRLMTAVSSFAAVGWLASVLPAEELEGICPGTTWAKKTSADVGLDAAKLAEFGKFVGGRGCVVRHGYLVHAWGDVSRRTDLASACKPLYSHLH